MSVNTPPYIPIFGSGPPAFTAAQGRVYYDISASYKQYIYNAGVWQATGAAGAGTVTSVGLAAPAEFIVSGSPVTNSGTLTLTKQTQSANKFYMGPGSGAAAQPTFRDIVEADLTPIRGQYIGTNTNNNANAGNIGEYQEIIVPFAGRVSLVTGTSKTIATLNLSAGDWDTWGVFTLNPSSTVDQMVGGMSLVTNTLPTNNTALTAAFTAASGQSVVVPYTRFSFSVATNIFLVVNSSFAGTNEGYGSIRARRAR